MSGLDSNILTEIHIQLLNIISTDVKPTLDKVEIKTDLLERLGKQDNGELEIISRVREYVRSSKKIAEDLLEWNDALLRREDTHTKKVSMHSEFIVAAMLPTLNKKQLTIVNHTKDLHPAVSCSTSLLKITFQKVLEYCIDLAAPNASLEVNSHTDEKGINVSILISSLAHGYSAEPGGTKQDDAKSPEFNIWVPCYQLLKFYRGNLWKEEMKDGKLVVNFCIPTVKSNP